MTTAGRWLRVSSTHQDEASQEPDVDRWITQRGYEVKETYRIHGYSAYHGEHEPEVRRMMADMVSGKIEVLVVWKSDRLERRGAYALMGLIAEAAKVGGRIEFVTEPALNNASDPIAGPMLQAFYGAMGHHESKTKSDRTLIKQAALRAAGSFAVGAEPYGYDIVPLGDGRKTLRPNADQAPVVKRIFREVAAGRTFYDVAKGLSDDGIPTYFGGEAWSPGALKHIVRRIAYRGLVQYKGVTYLEVEPLVTAAEWLAANESVKTRLRGGGIEKVGRPIKRIRPICGRCGGAMYRYKNRYRCAGKGPQPKGCGNTIGLEALEAEVWEEFREDAEPYIEEVVDAAVEYAEEIATVQLAIKDLDVLAPDYDDRHKALVAELRRLVGLKTKPEERRTVYLGRTEGDVFKEMTFEEQQAEVRRWALTVWPQDSEDQRALVAALKGRRWTLTYLGA